MQERSGRISGTSVVNGVASKVIDFDEDGFRHVLDPGNDFPIGATVTITWKENAK